MAGPSTDGAPVTDAFGGAVGFAAAEAERQAQAGASVHSGAAGVLRWASRRRRVIELAAAKVRDDETLSPPVRAAAVEILERVLAGGLLY